MKDPKLSFTPNEASQALNIDISSLTNVRCPNCKNQVFQPLFIVKRVSALQSPSGKEGVAPMQIFACTSCGAVPKEFGGTLIEKDELPEKSIELEKDESREPEDGK